MRKIYSTWRLGWVGVAVAIGLGTTGWVSAQSTSGGEPGTSASSTPMGVSTPLTTDEKSFVLAVAQADVFQMDAASLAGRKATSSRASQQALLGRLRGLGGTTFDREYVRTTNDRQLRAFAEAQLPALEQNVREARASVEARRG